MKKFYRIDDEERLDYLTQMARGEIDKDEESSSSESELESDAMDLANYEDEKQVEDIAMGEITKRFAIMNCDWTRLRAVDIFALCQVEIREIIIQTNQLTQIVVIRTCDRIRK